MSEPTAKKARIPPRWFVRSAWVVHRGIYKLSRGRFGLWHPKPDGWGTMLVTTVGRRSGQERQVILGYIEDGPNLVTMAMNGWGAAEPAWWLNLQAHPEATVQLRDETRPVRARAAQGAERERLWAVWREKKRTWTNMPRSDPVRPRSWSWNRSTMVRHQRVCPSQLVSGGPGRT